GAPVRGGLGGGRRRLISAVEPPRAEHISSEAGGMQSPRDRLREIWLSHDDRYGRAADRVAKDHEAGWAPAIEGNGGFGNDRKGFARPTAKLRDRIGSDDH